MADRHLSAGLNAGTIRAQPLALLLIISMLLSPSLRCSAERLIDQGRVVNGYE